MENKTVYSLIISIVNRGYSDEVMDAARDAGAKGGTIVVCLGPSRRGFPGGIMTSYFSVFSSNIEILRFQQAL